ncbi:MAG: CDP-alcohol phosphatidyltransferase family protein [Hyphomicrobium sp.]
MTFSTKGEISQPHPLYTIPNVLSLIRGLTGPLVLALITSGTPWTFTLALGLMVLAELSDFFDGEIARRYQQETELGKLVDPICDSIYHLSVFLAFLAMHWMPAWMLFVIYARDLIVPYLRTFARQGGHDLQIRTSGKIKTAVHALAQIGVMLIALGYFGQKITTEGMMPYLLLLLATGASVYSLVDYCNSVRHFITR